MSTLYLNFANAEQLIFMDEAVFSLLPHHLFNYLEQWKLAKRLPFLRQFGKTAILDFLNQLKPEDLEQLEEYFGNKIVVEKLHYSIARHIKVPVQEEQICAVLNEIVEYGNFTTWRDQDHWYLSCWR